MQIGYTDCLHTVCDCKQVVSIFTCKREIHLRYSLHFAYNVFFGYKSDGTWSPVDSPSGLTLLVVLALTLLVVNFNIGQLSYIDYHHEISTNTGHQNTF